MWIWVPGLRVCNNLYRCLRNVLCKLHHPSQVKISFEITLFTMRVQTLKPPFFQAKKSVKAMSTYLCTNGGDSGEKGPCHKKFKRAVPTAKLLKDLPATKMVEASEQELGGESQVADNLKKMPHMPEEALQMYTRDDVEELAIDEMMKEGMDEEEARTMYRELKDSGYFDNPSEHLHHVTENDETAPTNTHSEDEYVGGDL